MNKLIKYLIDYQSIVNSLIKLIDYQLIVNLLNKLISLATDLLTSII